MKPDIEEILRRVQAGDLSIGEAQKLIAESPEADIGFARIDLDRQRRRGMPEVIFSPGKTADQIVGIMKSMQEHGQNVMATRVSPEQHAVIKDAFPDCVYHEQARIVTLDCTPLPPGKGLVAIVAAGTSDIPVAEEAAITCERTGSRVERIYDVGVAGLHRLMKHLPILKSASVVVVAAGMEGALPSVVGGLIDRPIVAVPTSVGYGTGLKGVSALLAMLNTCVPGITVVNIDNGFGAGVAAGMINRGQTK